MMRKVSAIKIIGHSRMTLIVFLFRYISDIISSKLRAMLFFNDAEDRFIRFELHFSFQNMQKINLITFIYSALK